MDVSPTQAKAWSFAPSLAVIFVYLFSAASILIGLIFIAAGDHARGVRSVLTGLHLPIFSVIVLNILVDRGELSEKTITTSLFLLVLSSMMTVSTRFIQEFPDAVMPLLAASAGVLLSVSAIVFFEFKKAKASEQEGKTISQKIFRAFFLISFLGIIGVAAAYGFRFRLLY